MSESEKLKKAVRRILRTHNVDLKDFVQHDLQRIAGDFHAKELITQTKVDEMKVSGVLDFTLAAKLVDACQPSLVTYPEKNFPRFIGVLKKYETTENLARTMETEFKAAGGKMPDEGGRSKPALTKRVATSPSSAGESAAFVPVDQSPSLPTKRLRLDPDPEVPSAYRDQSPDSPDLGSPLEEHQEVQKPKGSGQKAVYHVTTRKSHALAVILNNYKFKCKGFKNLPKSEDDVLLLQTVLEDTLGFEVVTFENQTGEQIRQLFESHIGRRIKKHHDSFFCCIMSHGGEDGVSGTDGDPVSTAEFMEFLDADSCKNLSGKPKIMIMDYCRGHRIPKPALSKDQDTQPKPISPRSDFIFGYSTVEGDIATIDWHGSLYIQKLCEAMERNDCSLNQMLCTVNRALNEEGEQRVRKGRKVYKFVQTGQVEHTLQDFVVFQKP